MFLDWLQRLEADKSKATFCEARVSLPVTSRETERTSVVQTISQDRRTDGVFHLITLARSLVLK
jgi:hypothetical protein